MGLWELTFPTKIPRRATHLVNDVGLRVGVVILHAPPTSGIMAAVVATPYSEILASYTYYTMTACATSTGIGGDAVCVLGIRTVSHFLP